MEKKYIFSNLVCELSGERNSADLRDAEFKAVNANGFEIHRLKVKSKKGAQEYGIGIGEYATLYCPSVTDYDEEQKQLLVLTIADEIKHLMSNNSKSIFVAGLGNIYLSSDSVGPKCVAKLNVTRHISIHQKELFESLNTQKISAIAPGVMSQTGIESAEIFKGVTDITRPDTVIIVDSLCARSPERLASTVQISNTGLVPGEGVGNKRQKIDAQALGCSVISIGIPTVVSSSTLIYDALKKGGVDCKSEKLEHMLENSTSYFVTVNEIEEITDIISDIISRAIYQSACIDTE